MQALTFEVEERVAPSAPERADVACFVGYVRRRPDAPVSAAVSRFLSEAGWSSGPYQRVNPANPQDPLRDVPLPFESFDAFARVFAWEARSADPREGATYLGAAVRSFFAQGGRKCYVVVAGDPLPDGSSRAARLARLAGPRAAKPLLPDDISAVDRSTWSGIGHLHGLDDVSFLVLPDVPELVAVEPAPLPLPPLPPATDPQFVECAEETPPDEPSWHTPERSAPRCDLQGYEQWGTFLLRVADLIRSDRGHLREAHLVAALPRPAREEAVELPSGQRVAADHDLGRYLHENGVLTRFRSAFVQLAYPWGKTRGSEGLPEKVEPLDGVLAGTLARNALLRGTFRSAVGLAPADLTDLAPVPTRVDQALLGPGAPMRGLVERVSLFGPTARGLRLFSDVTSSHLEAFRMAPASRLMAVILRAARHAGLEHAFEPASPATWKELRRRLERVLTRLFDAGALRGASPAEAFEVRCDRTTMTQDDLDAGRIIARIVVDPAASLERLQVVLAVAEGGVAVAPEAGP